MKSNHKPSLPPGLANWLASKFIDESYLEEFFGDLQEMYEERLKTKGKLYAGFMHWVDVFHLLFGFASTGLFKTQNSNTMMIRNMFKIAWRNAVRQKQFTILNMLGLTIGVAACLLIGLYVYNENSYDTFFANGDRIYRINQPDIWGDWKQKSSATGPNVAIALREDAPEFEEVTRILDRGAQTVRIPQDGKIAEPFNETEYYIAEENFFKVFSFEFVEGDPATALLDTDAAVITLETARRYFGHADPMGKLIQVKEWNGEWSTFIVRGVLADIPERSHLQFNVLISLNSMREPLKDLDWKWIWTGFSTYGLVTEGTDIAALTDKLQAIPPKWAAATAERIFNQTYEEFTRGNPWTLYLQPLREIYASGDPEAHRFGPTGIPQFVQLFAAIGMLVLLLSSINFMNLATARSAGRAKEVGIRKVLGSGRRALMAQFVFESLLFVAASTLLALLLVGLSLDGFNSLADKKLDLVSELGNPIFIGTLLSFVLLLGLLAGSYPAFYLSSFKPVEVLKGRVRAGFRGKGIRNGLVVFQFTISIALIICTFFVQKQLAYTSQVDLGYSSNNILQLHNLAQLGKKEEILITRLQANPAFTHLGESYGVPPYIRSGDRYKARETAQGTDNPVVELSNLRTEGSYLDLLGVQFVEGRNFEPDRVNDKYGVILNEKAAKTLGWTNESAVGKYVIVASDNEPEFEVLGVLKDFNINSVKQKIDPLIILHKDNDKIWDYQMGRLYVSMRINPEVVNTSGTLQKLIEEVEGELAAVDASVPFEYSFMDQEFENTFKSEQRVGAILNLFTAMALAIACLGLFGLAAFSAEQRTKELGIRKVLGAKAAELALLFSSEFTRLIFISIVLASPVAWYLVDAWLNDFAYRTTIDVWVFVVAAGSALAIALGTITYQSLSVTRRNPVDVLKDE
ncbi:ABC transporter permease [Imperialibacter roseus]|uniref:ABC transporter permease n=1 Tax=Imperialibacter roseus TaxID=1324217 RepID=A0ABZ0IZ93_9BACT|nr:ABC transporter permease [Imperialibacter roseus]WOK09006.1 ABC transporter permease [Imperialibacter roseus]